MKKRDEQKKFLSDERGLLISFDALIAIAVMLIMFITTTFYLLEIEISSNQSITLKQISLDIATTLEKYGDFEEAVIKNRSENIRSFLNQLPYSICSEVKIFEEGDLNNVRMVVLRSDCSRNYDEIAAVNRSFLVSNGNDLNFFIATVSTWYRVVD